LPDDAAKAVRSLRRGDGGLPSSSERARTRAWGLAFGPPLLRPEEVHTEVVTATAVAAMETSAATSSFRSALSRREVVRPLAVWRMGKWIGGGR
jgi:hypothetical protein